MTDNIADTNGHNYYADRKSKMPCFAWVRRTRISWPWLDQYPEKKKLNNYFLQIEKLHVFVLVRSSVGLIKLFERHTNELTLENMYVSITKLQS
jgi:hypothetical protein